jgi:hypothetical protein
VVTSVRARERVWVRERVRVPPTALSLNSQSLGSVRWIVRIDVRQTGLLRVQRGIGAYLCVCSVNVCVAVCVV